MVYSTLQKNKQASSSSYHDLSSSTTNTHDNEDSKCLPRKSTQPSFFEAVKKQSPLPSSNKRTKEITDAITHFLAKDSVPFNAVECPGFRHLLHVLEPRYEVPAKLTFSRYRVVKLYDATWKQVLDELNNSLDYFTTTTDMWSSHGMTPYVGFTLHWIDDKWNLKTRCLGTKFVQRIIPQKSLVAVQMT